MGSKALGGSEGRRATDSVHEDARKQDPCRRRSPFDFLSELFERNEHVLQYPLSVHADRPRCHASLSRLSTQEGQAKPPPSTIRTPTPPSFASSQFTNPIDRSVSSARHGLPQQRTHRSHSARRPSALLCAISAREKAPR